MDIENMTALAAKLRTLKHMKHSSEAREAKEQGVEGFNLALFFFTCGTPACIGGWACSMAGYGIGHDTIGKASEWLDLPVDAATVLFMPVGLESNYTTVTPEQAAQAVENMLNLPDVTKADESNVWYHVSTKVALI